MKIIFLDIDGVLNNIETKFRALVPECIAALNRITDNTRAQIVISSTWRYIFGVEETANRLRTAGCTGLIIDGTPSPRASRQKYSNTIIPAAFEDGPMIVPAIGRVEAIQLWLAHHPEVTNYIAIDDDYDIEKLGNEHALFTDPTTGLTEVEADKAIALLNHHTI